MSEEPIRTIRSEWTVYELCTKHPDIRDILHELGFVDILKPGMLQTAGRFMTLPRGAKMKGIDLERVRERLREAGYELT